MHNASPRSDGLTAAHVLGPGEEDRQVTQGNIPVDLPTPTMSRWRHQRELFCQGRLSAVGVFPCDNRQYAEIKLSPAPDIVDDAARSLLRLRDKMARHRVEDLAALMVVTSTGPAYRRPDNVQVMPLTALGP